MKRIQYKKQVNFEGRNGYFKQSGLEIMTSGDLIELFPVTSRGAIGRGLLEIPRESLPEVIAALTALEMEGK